MLIKLLAVARLKFGQDASGSGTASDKSFKSWQRTPSAVIWWLLFRRVML